MKISDRPYHGLRILDETAVPPWKTLSPLLGEDGGRIETASEWMRTARPRFLQLFEREMFGERMRRPDSMRFELLSEKRDALGGIAVRKEIRIHCAMNSGRSIFFDLLLCYPNTGKGPFPGFLALNGRGNHAAISEPDVRISDRPVVDWSRQEAFATLPPDATTRGVQMGNMPFEFLVKRGYAGATICISEIFYDSPEAFSSSVYSLFKTPEELSAPKKEFGAIGAWAWGLSRGLDALETIPEIDASKIGVAGFSRLGKTALFAGARDSRFAMTISNESGCGGAALSRRKFGETVDFLLFWRDYWFSDRFQRYRNNEELLPFDQNFLIALSAPRPVCVGSATLDSHSDPKGEYLGLRGAAEVFELFGDRPFPGDPETMPSPGAALESDLLHYHIREGEHDFTLEDWKLYLDFADRHFQSGKAKTKP